MGQIVTVMHTLQGSWPASRASSTAASRRCPRRSPRRRCDRTCSRRPPTPRPASAWTSASACCRTTTTQGASSSPCWRRCSTALALSSLHSYTDCYQVSLCPWERVKKSSSAKDVTTEAEEVADNVESLDIKTSEPPQKRFRGFREDPFIYFNDDEKVFDNIRKYYNLTLPPSLFLHRNKVEAALSLFRLKHPNTVFLLPGSDHAQEQHLLQHGEGAADRGEQRGQGQDHQHRGQVLRQGGQQGQ